jgi:hypothetical protein
MYKKINIDHLRQLNRPMVKGIRKLALDMSSIDIDTKISVYTTIDKLYFVSHKIRSSQRRKYSYTQLVKKTQRFIDRCPSPLKISHDKRKAYYMQKHGHNTK